MVNSEELIGTTEYLTLRINRCRCNGVNILCNQNLVIADPSGRVV
jgi:hypothetical protein